MIPKRSFSTPRSPSRLDVVVVLILALMLATVRALAVSATAFFPANNALNVCADTPLKITLDAVPTVGTTGTIKIFNAATNALVDTIDLVLNSGNGTQARTIGGTSYNTYPVLVAGNVATIFPHAGVLAYGTSYYVTVDAGVFTGFAGLSGNAAWRFTTKAGAPSSASTYVVVAADGTGDFCTVQGAVDWVPAANTTRRYINVRNGTYQEIVRVSAKHNLAFRGQNRKRTIISYPNNNNINASTNTRPLFNVVANDVSFDNLTLSNATPSGGSQAEALRVNGQRCIVANCDVHSFQDTVLVNSATDTAYFVNSFIEGDVDFIWGSGRAVFKGCEIKSLSSGYVCQMRNPAAQYGAVFLDCRFTRAAGVTNVVLARIDPNTFPDSAVALVNCAMDAHITSAGWLLTAAGPTAGLRFWEYQSTDLAGAALNVGGRASFSAQINVATATSLRTLPTTFGGWTPVPPLPAFPGAEGAGANTLGGRGGDVYYVTTLADSGVGSLRDAINTAPNGGRTILFKVSGTIALNSNFQITKPRITIAGQSAPGGGICLKNWTLRLNADDLVVRHIRSRLGTDAAREDDAITIWGGINVMVDHCSASWSVDEVFSCTGDSDNVTTQWCYVSEALDNSIHSKGPHGFGSIIASNLPARISWHHNLYAHNESRNPRPASYNGSVVSLDLRNNVFYDWGYKIGYSGGSPEATDINYIANYLVKGPASTSNSAFQGGGTTTRIFQSGNKIDLNTNGAFDGTDTGWGMFIGTYTQMASAFDFALSYSAETAEFALQRVISQVGARPWARDSKDAQIAADVVAGTGGFVDTTAEAGGYPVLESAAAPLDSDNDGMPNFWEAAVGLNPSVADNNADRDGDGYTNLEEYLNWLAAPHTVTPTSTAVDVDLTTMNGGRSGLTYTLSSAVNGTVALLGDGHTARFTPTAGFNGLGSFAFSFTALGNTISQTVGVCMTNGLPTDLTWVGTTGVWDIATTANFSDAGAASTFTNGDTVSFGQSGVTTNVTMTGALTPSAMTVNATKDYTFGGTGSLAGGMAVTKTGAGKLTLNTANTYTGGTSVTGGTLALGNAAGAGTGPISLDGATFNIGVLNVTNAVSFTGTNTVVGAAFAKLTTMSGDGTVNVNVSSTPFDLNGNMSAFEGTLALTTNINMRFVAGSGSSGATFDLGTGTGNTTVRNNLPAIAVGALRGGSGTVFAGQSNNNFPTTFTIGGNGTDSTFSGSIRDGAGGAAAITHITKTGAGTLTFSGANTYTGATLVSAGTLNVTGSLGATAVTVANGATLAGTGSIAGSVAVQGGGNLVTGTGAAGTLSIGGGLWLADTALTFDLTNATTTGGGVNDFISLGGGQLTLTGTITITPNLLNGPLVPGTYTLISGGATMANTATFVWGGAELGGRQSVAINTSTPGALKLVVTGASASLFWNGAGGTTWDAGDPVNAAIGAANWRNGTAADRFVKLDAVTFDDTLNVGTAVLAGNVEPRAVLVNNATKAVSINSTAGSIAGATAFTKSGAGTLTLDGANTFTGGFTLNAGTVQLASDSANTNALGSGPITLKGGTLAMYSNFNSTTSSNTSTWDLIVPTGFTGGLNCDSRCFIDGTLSGGGTMNLFIPDIRTEIDGDWSAFTGQINVTTDANGGEFRIGNNYSPTGLPDAAMSLGPRATLSYVGIVNTADTIVELGTLTGDALSILRGGPTSGRTFTWQIGKRNADMSFAGIISEQSAGCITALVKVGAGALRLSGACSHVGATTVASGALFVNGNITASGVQVNSGATLGGGGSIASATVASGGILAPGDGVGTFTTTAPLTFNSGSRLEWELATNTTTADRVSGGAISIAANVPVNVTLNRAGSTVDFSNAFWNSARNWPVTSASAQSGTFTLGTVSNDIANRPASAYGTFSLSQNATGTTLVWSPRPAIEQWRYTWFGTNANSGTAADTADANGDREVNLLEFATGQNPNAATVAATGIVRNGATLEFTYHRANSAMSGGVSFTAEWSDTLAANSWSNAGVTEQILSDNGTVQTVKASVAAGTGTRFLRLKISKP